MSDDQKAWKEVEVCCTEDKDAEACLSPTWQDLWRTALLDPQQDRRQEKEVRFCQNYLAHFNHGTATHTNLVLVAKLANVFDAMVTLPMHAREKLLCMMNSEADCRCRCGCKDECLCSEDEEAASCVEETLVEHVEIRT